MGSSVPTTSAKLESGGSHVSGVCSLDSQVSGLEDGKSSRLLGPVEHGVGRCNVSSEEFPWENLVDVGRRGLGR